MCNNGNNINNQCNIDVLYSERSEKSVTWHFLNLISLLTIQQFERIASMYNLTFSLKKERKKTEELLFKG